MKKATGLRFLWLSAFVLVIDFFSKYWIVSNFSLYESVKVVPCFNFTYVRNFGAAFSFLAEHSGWQKFIFIALALVISGFLLKSLQNNPASKLISNLAYALIIGGALGNAIDRWVNGYVIDFLDFYYRDWHYPTFNVADIAICIGAGLLIIDLIRQPNKHHEKSNESTAS